MRLSERGLQLLRSIEGLSLKAYRDAGGWSIGYGHFIKPEENALLDGISLAKADALLLSDTAWAVKAVNRYVMRALAQSQFDALTSLVYNIGETQFRKSTLLRRLNQGQLQAAADQFDVWIHSEGVVDLVLVKRRAREKALFQTV